MMEGWLKGRFNLVYDWMLIISLLSSNLNQHFGGEADPEEESEDEDDEADVCFFDLIFIVFHI